MAEFKNIRIKIGKKPKGKDTRKSRLQRVKVLASGKFKFVKNVSKSKKSSKVNKTKNRRKNKVAKKKNKKKASKVIHIPLALGGGIVGALSTKAPSGNSIIGRIRNGDIEGAMYDAREIFTGVDANGQFKWDFIKRGWTPIIIGAVTHMAAQKLGINRALYQAQNGLPIKIGL